MQRFTLIDSVSQRVKTIQQEDLLACYVFHKLDDAMQCASDDSNPRTHVQEIAQLRDWLKVQLQSGIHLAIEASEGITRVVRIDHLINSMK